MKNAPQEIWFGVCRNSDNEDIAVAPTHRSAAGYFSSKAAALQHAEIVRPQTEEEKQKSGTSHWVRVKAHAALKGTVTYEVVPK